MPFPKAFKFLFFAALLGAAFTPVHCLYFNYTDFQLDRDAGMFIFGNYSTISQGAIQVTPDDNGASMSNRSGRFLYKKPFGLWSQKGTTVPFNTSFVLNIKNITNTGGEGMTFILTGDTDVPADSSGQWLGIVNPPEINGTSQPNVVAIEFDTRKSYPDDLDDNHVGLDINSIYSIPQVSLNASNLTLSSGKDVPVLVQYDGDNLTVFVGQDPKDPVFSVPIDLSAHLPQKVYVGFSASTSQYIELNCVKSWMFKGSDKPGTNRLLVWIVVPVGFVLLLGAFLFLFWRRRNRRLGLEEAYPNIEAEIEGSSTAPTRFRLKDLQKATGKFSPKNQLGQGGFGTVYKGTLGDKEVAVKRISKEKNQGKSEFIAEVTTIGNLHHRNLVKLIGWCYENREFLLVYEFMPNGSLEKFIFAPKNSDVIMETLSWNKRLSIISGVAQAVEYLHNGCEKKVLHRDIKASNIMLDLEFNAKLGDFGLARTIKQRDQTHHTTKELAGTPGYMAPEFILTGRTTAESDVYAFGVLVLEVACGRKPHGQTQQDDFSSNIVNWVWELRKGGKILDAADSRLKADFENEEMECLLILGLACCHPNPNKRPAMKAVSQILMGEAPVPEVPTERPRFMWPPLPPSFKDMDYSLTGSQLTPFSQLAGR